jgi:hypothetical protein
MKLKLGPLPKNETVKLTIQLSGELKAKLEQYAKLHSEAFGQRVGAAALIPLMLQTFMDRDRGFRSLQKRERHGNHWEKSDLSSETAGNSDELADRR